MDNVKKLIQNLDPEEWKKLYRWALQEEYVRREKEQLKLEIIQDVLGEEPPADEPEEEVADGATES